MCGITGILSPTGTSETDIDLTKQMIAALNHRGPDAWGIYASGDICLGHSRLSIIDIQSGHQPMATDRHVLIYNGAIFNYLELRKDLRDKGAIFRTQSDTEVVLKAFEIYGSDAVSGFNGQFALLLWDRREKTLTIARDRYGIRPLYVLELNGIHYFASEMKAFDRIPKFRRTMDMENLFEHALFWNTLGDHTLYKNIRSLEPGTFQIFKEGRPLAPRRYYQIGEARGTQPPPADFGQARETFVDLLKDAVDLRLRSDVPVGAYLSGGIDSSVITLLTQKIKNEKLVSFSIAFDDPEFDESSYQQEMTRILNVDHSAVQISYQRINENLLDAVYHFEQPVFRSAPVPLYLLSEQVARKGIKVVLTGEGADEILYGYDSYKELKLLEFWNRFPGSKLRPQLIKRLYPHLMHYNEPKQYGLMKMYYESFLDDFANPLAGLNIRMNNNKILLNYLHPDHRVAYEKEKYVESVRAMLPEDSKNWSLLQKNQFLEMKTLLSGYLLSSQGDRMAMAHSIEGRYPFLDHRVVEQLFAFPDSYKLNGFSQKHLLVKSFENAIPKPILQRPKKPYTAPDLKSFFPQNALSETAAYFLSPEMIRDYGIFEENRVRRFLRKFQHNVPEAIGYRDNMLITFMLSCQMALYWTKHKKETRLPEDRLKVNLIDMTQ